MNSRLNLKAKNDLKQTRPSSSLNCRSNSWPFVACSHSFEARFFPKNLEIITLLVVTKYKKTDLVVTPHFWW
jgi:hypothetical protein